MSYIKLDRKITEWEWFTDGNMLKLWIYLLTNAQYKETYFKGIKIERGQVVVGRKKLAEKLDLSEQQVRTFLKRLEINQQITIKPTNKYSLITIVKYSEYQDSDDDDNQQQHTILTNEQPTNNQQITTIQEYKEYKKEKNKYIVFKKPTLEEVQSYCLERNNNVDAQRFIDYYTANGWKVGRNPMKDWKATVRTWERKDKPSELPTYNTTNNIVISTEEQDEILRLMKG